jgi:hypothetical protein
MFLNPLARLVSSIMLFLVLIVLLEEYITINTRGLIKRKREEKNK